MSKDNGQLINRVFSSFSKELSEREYSNIDNTDKSLDAKSSMVHSWSDSLSNFVNTNFHALKNELAHKILVTPYCYQELPQHLKDSY